MPSMRTIIGGQFQAIVTERITSNKAATRKAIGIVKAQNTKGISSAATVRWHGEAIAARQDTGRWEAIGRRVSR